VRKYLLWMRSLPTDSHHQSTTELSQLVDVTVWRSRPWWWRLAASLVLCGGVMIFGVDTSLLPGFRRFHR
jgi:hypothetical protein